MFAYRNITTSINITKLIPQLCGINAIRNGHRLRGARPGVAKTIKQRQEEIRLAEYDPDIEKKIDIGFPQIRLKRAEEMKKQGIHLKGIRKDFELEKKARNLELEIDLNDVRNEWLTTNGPNQIKTIATHYGVYQDLFGRAYFLPRVPFKVKYKISEDEYVPVCYGNILKPNQTKSEPVVRFDPRCNLTGKEEGNSLWTLVLTNPDGHFTENDKEYVHWFVANIPNDDISKGEVIVPYLQPFPPKGTGFHRHIFILYKQTKKLDFNEYKVEQLNDLSKRTFSTLNFYKKHEDHITPGSLAFFQSDYDTSLTDFYHEVLDMKEPIFEYDFPGPYYRDEVLFPLREPFNLYLDLHRDPKEINKEYLERKLSKTHPFDGPEEPLKFPNVHRVDRWARFETDLQQGRVNSNGSIHTPSWLKTEIRKRRQGLCRTNEFKSKI